MRELYRAYQCEFSGRIFGSPQEARQCEFDEATKIIGTLKGPADLRLALRKEEQGGKVWRAVAFLSANQHWFAAEKPVPVEKLEPIATLLEPITEGVAHG
jgi:hypothetical protein